MLKEVTKAVEVFHKIAFKNSEAKKNISESQFSAFVTILIDLLMVRYEKFWFPDEPERASGYRCLRVNGQCFDPVVSESLTKAGVPVHKHKKLIFHDVTVWVDPGVVSMRIGEDGSIGHDIVDELLYARNMAKRVGSPKPKLKDLSDSDADSGVGSRSPSPPDSPTSASSTPSRSTKFSPPPQEYNPYTMSSRVCNANRGLSSTRQQAVTPPQIQQRTMTPPSATMYSTHQSTSQQQRSILSRPIQASQAQMTVSAVQRPFQGHIPSSASMSSSGSATFPSARRNVFGESMGAQDSSYQGKMVPSHMPMGYHNNPPNTYMDIPVVA